MSHASANAPAPSNFIRNIIDADRQAGKNDGKVHTRFPPEPNGFLHIGHAKSICLNFGVAKDYQGQCNLRFDDTNPAKEEQAYVDAIMADIKWLGFDWQERLLHASDYFSQLHEFAVELIRKGSAFVCGLNAEEMRSYRGTLTEPGKNSPERSRSIDENLKLFAGMKNGDYAEGEYTLRAKIDMASPNLNLRDPIIYRIRKVTHQRTGDDWCIYPMYDFTHGISDALEGITHSLCTLEFEDHRPLYDWYLEQLSLPCHPQQIEFARLELDYIITSKRKLKELVDSGDVSGWDDPRMPTLSGMRRRGFPASAIRDLCDRVGVTKKNSTIDFSVLEACVRDALANTRRVMAVLEPLKVIITNLPDDAQEVLTAAYHPQKPELGTREMPFSRELYIERSDFMEDAPKKFFRLRPGGYVRLRYAYIIRCDEVLKDGQGNVTALMCSYEPSSKSGQDKSGIKVKGVIHWVSVQHAMQATVRLYDRLFKVPNPTADKDVDFKSHLNSDSIERIDNAQLEPAIADLEPQDSVQFERTGYFCTDSIEHTPENPVFNRIISLRDSWAKTSS